MIHNTQKHNPHSLAFRSYKEWCLTQVVLKLVSYQNKNMTYDLALFDVIVNFLLDINLYLEFYKTVFTLKKFMSR